MKILSIDTETTGLTKQDKLCELGMVLYNRDHDITERMYASLDDPYIEIHPEATAVHGITNEMVKGIMLNEIETIDMGNQADYIIAHNGTFDMLMVQERFPKEEAFATNKWLDTKSLIDWTAHYPRVSNRKLNHIAADLGIFNPNAHRALYDADLLIQLVKPHLDELIEKGTAPWYHFKAYNTPFEKKDLIKQRGYSAQYEDHKFQYWHREVIDLGDNISNALKFLADTIYENEDKAEANVNITIYNHWSQLPSNGFALENT